MKIYYPYLGYNIYDFFIKKTLHLNGRRRQCLVLAPRPRTPSAPSAAAAAAAAAVGGGRKRGGGGNQGIQVGLVRVVVASSRRHVACLQKNSSDFETAIILSKINITVFPALGFPYLFPWLAEAEEAKRSSTGESKSSLELFVL